MTFRERMLGDITLIDAYLEEYIEGLFPFGNLPESMHYSLMAGGKRIRPVLTLAACRFCGGKEEDALAFAAAVEMVHTYSLIHDDLPAMDNDDFRRGKPTSHRKFGQAGAILAGDALLTEAFLMLTKSELSPKQIVGAVACLSRGAGAEGMVAGQVLDMNPKGEKSLSYITMMEKLKTGKLIVTALELGAIAADASEEEISALRSYGEKLGLAFQIQDDILDCIGSQRDLGKDIGSDKAMGKTTFVSLLGLLDCQSEVKRLCKEAKEAIEPFEGKAFLVALVDMLENRKK